MATDAAGKRPVEGTLKRIVLLIDTRGSYAASVLHGVRRYADSARDWQCLTIEPLPEAIPVLQREPPDGILGTFYKSRFARSVRSLRTPTVEVSDWYSPALFPRVVSDNQCVGKLAAEHFLDRGLAALGFVGPMNLPWSSERYHGFADRLAVAGIKPLRFDPTDYPSSGWSAVSWVSPTPELVEWVTRAPKPVGILGANDQFASSVLNAAQISGIRVPEDLAVLGVDNDPLLCGLARPPLSSIAVGDERIGFEAASMLDRMLSGADPPESTVRVVGVEVIARQSSDVLAISDKEVLEALRFIRANASKGISVSDVLARVPLPRRTLERRFRTAIHRGPKEEIARVRIETAQMLLRSTDLPMRTIARRAGFSSAVHLSRAFGASQGNTPRSYRQQFQLPG